MLGEGAKNLVTFACEHKLRVKERLAWSIRKSTGEDRGDRSIYLVRIPLARVLKRHIFILWIWSSDQMQTVRTLAKLVSNESAQRILEKPSGILSVEASVDPISLAAHTLTCHQLEMLY
jgi:hypothetical protein